MNYFFHVLILLVLSLPLGVIAQNNSNSNDTLQYVVPTEIKADLNILVPPKCFEPTSDFNGYLCISNGSAIMIQMIDNISYLQATRDMNDSFFKQNGFQFISVFDLKSDYGVKGKVYKLTYNHKNQDYVRYMVFAGDLQKTIWLNITYPKIVEELMELEILSCLQSLTLNPADHEK
ncbi:MAG: hypothetical protein EP305_07265 [Bacteroidetes bacterium]|nr:MAG: hypothetical protein EP305_07265 [Bacteroidota bacterium]